VNPLLRNYDYRTETKNLVGDNFRDLASQILGLLGCFEHFTIGNLNDELHTSLAESACFQEWGQAAKLCSLPPPGSASSFPCSVPTYCFKLMRPDLAPVAAQ
jgi:hypothetical protein